MVNSTGDWLTIEGRRVATMDEISRYVSKVSEDHAPPPALALLTARQEVSPRELDQALEAARASVPDSESALAALGTIRARLRAAFPDLAGL
jgi:hypothetical protein